MHEHLNTIEKAYFTKVPMSTELESCLSQVNAWQFFCELPLSVKAQLSKNNGGVGEPRYIHRKLQAEPCIGEYFHLCENEGHNKNFCTTNIDATSEEKEVLEIFYSFAQSLHVSASGQLLALLEEAKNYYPDLSFTLRNRQVRIVTRFLHYIKLPDADIMSEHYDRGFFALALYENIPALEVYTGTSWQPVSLSENDTVVFCGVQGNDFTAQKLPKALHRVLSPKQNRFSIVSFLWFS